MQYAVSRNGSVICIDIDPMLGPVSGAQRVQFLVSPRLYVRRVNKPREVAYIQIDPVSFDSGVNAARWGWAINWAIKAAAKLNAGEEPGEESKEAQAET